VATLFGLQPPSPAACRLLELGCGDGGNLVPMAYALPASAFTGIDLSATALARAQALCDELALENVTLRRADLTALRELGTFDYVIAHGVYSWVQPAAREALLAACREHLAPHGVAYVSYDVFPGGHAREITRQMLRWHLRDVDDPAERIAGARALLTAVAQAGQPQAEWALGQSDPALYHDELAEHHEAVLFTDFVAHAERHGLQFLAEADVWEMQAGILPPGLAQDVIAREQYLDFFRGRMFRQTLLCRAEIERRDPTPEAVIALGVSERDADAALRAYLTHQIELHVWLPALAAQPSERPVASALARVQAAAGTRITTLQHRTVEVPDDLGRRLITLLDGTRDRAALIRELGRPADELERSLQGLAQLAVLER
jgi:SAM-dependent methyltransferase